MIVSKLALKAGFTVLVFSGILGCTQKNEKPSIPEWKETANNGFRYRYVTGDPMRTRFYTLANGLSVILSPNKREPRISCLMAVRAGSNNDPKNHTGLAHYLEHLLFKGTNQFGTTDSTREQPLINEITRLYELYNHTTDKTARKKIYQQIDSVSGIAAKYAIANEYDQIMAGMGSIETNAHTAFDETVYEENIPADAIDKYLAVQAERFRNPVFRLFHTELEAVYEEKNRSLDDDNSNVFDSLMAGLFRYHNYGQQTILGTTAHLKNPSLRAIREFYNTYYVPSNMGLILAGDFDADTLIGKIDKAFGSWPAANAPEYEAPEEPDFTEPVTKLVKGPDAESVSIGFRLPGAKNFDGVPESAIIQQLLYNGKAGLLDLNLNNQQKLLTSSSWHFPMKDYSLLVLSGNPKNGQTLEEVKNLLLNQVQKIKAGAFSDTILKAIALNYKVSRIDSIHSNDNRVNILMNEFIKNKAANWDKEVDLAELMQKVSKKQIMEFAEQNLGNYVIVYKEQGRNGDIEKVEKPPITPVHINRDIRSGFAKQVSEMPSPVIQPQWIDYNKDLLRDTSGNTELLYVPNTEDQLFRLSYRLDLGKWNNRYLPLAIQYLDFLGHSGRSSEQIKWRFYNLACNYNILTGNEHTTITITGLQENFSEAIREFEQLVRNCKADETALQSLKSRVIKSRQDTKLNKEAIAEGLRIYAAYGANNPFNYQLSNNEINELSADTLINLLHDLFNYSHRIIYYGPMKQEAFAQEISKLHSTPPTWISTGSSKSFERRQPAGKEVLYAPYNMVQAEIQWINNSVIFDSTLTPVVELFNQYFGGSMASLVFQTIRESRALAYTAYAFYRVPPRKNGFYSTYAYLGTQEDKMKEAILAMDQLLNHLPYSPSMLETARKAILKRIANERIREDAIAFNYLYAGMLGVKTDQRRWVFEKVKSISFEELNKFFTDYIAGKNYSYCIIGPEECFRQSSFLQPAVARKLSPEEIFGY